MLAAWSRRGGAGIVVGAVLIGAGTGGVGFVVLGAGTIGVGLMSIVNGAVDIGQGVQKLEAGARENSPATPVAPTQNPRESGDTLDDFIKKLLDPFPGGSLNQQIEPRLSSSLVHGSGARGSMGSSSGQTPIAGVPNSIGVGLGSIPFGSAFGPIL